MEDLAARIKLFNKDRLPGILPYKYKLMATNMYRFYRGTCHLFYEDLYHANPFPASPAGWISGDLHLENFGSFRSSNNQVYFDLNDFDEAVLAPIIWEPARLLTSIFIAFETLHIEERRAMKMASLYLKTYAQALARGKPAYIEPNTAQGIVADFLKGVAGRKQKEVLAKRTAFRKKKLAIELEDPRHLKIEPSLKKELFHHISQWLDTDDKSPYNYKVIDGTFRLAGTGSLGLKRYVFLLKTLNKTGEKYMLIDMKQACPSSLAPFLVQPQPEWESDASRVTLVQQMMQNHSPALLSTSVFRNEHYVMQEMQPSKDSINFKQLKNQYRDMYRVIADMAVLTASSQLRSTGQKGAAITDDLKKFGADERWQQPLFDYARAYSHVVKVNFAQYEDRYANGAFVANELRAARSADA